MKNFILTYLIIVSNYIYSQVLQVDNSLTPQQLVENVLVGSGVQIFNVTFNGQAGTNITQQAGQFNGAGTNLGLNTGLIMCTGNITVAPGPNNQEGASGFINVPFYSDPDLNMISTNSLEDLAVIEFDFIPNGDSISFKYVFASEEYNEFTCSDYNDVFGFFISGPGINGPFSNGAKNIAIIPGTNTPVAINTVNLGISGDAGEASNCSAIDPNWQDYNIYFNNNTQQSIQFDGMTKILTAASEVQCGQTYHIKMAIADAGDTSYDSGVFLEAGSLNSIGVDISLKTVTGDTIIYEGCTDAEFIFTRPISQTNEQLTVNFTLSGSATENVDYFVTPSNNAITFEVGQDSVSVILSTIGIIDENEGDETVIITATFTTACGNTITISKTLIITEEPIIDANSNNPTLNCPNDSVIGIVEVIGGTPPYSYTWRNSVGETVGTTDTAYLNIQTVGQHVFNVLINDFCGFEFQKEVIVTLNPKPPLSLSVSAPNATCITPTIPITAVGSGGLAPLTFTWDTGQNGAIINANTFGNPPPTYTVTMKDACGDSIQASHTIVFDSNPNLIVEANDVIIKCPSNEVSITAIASNGFEPYTYTWSDGVVSQTNIVEILENGSVSYTVNVLDNCGNTGSANLSLTLNKTLEIVSITPNISYLCEPTGSAVAEIIGETGNIIYNWSGPGANSTNIINTQTLENQYSGWYYLTVEDDVCQDKDSVFINFLQNPVANFSIEEPNIDPPKSIVFNNLSVYSTNFVWDFGNGENQSTNTLENVSSIYKDITTYTITLYAYNGPCVDSISKTITILPNPKITLVNIFTPNGDGDNDEFTLNPLFFKEFIFEIHNRWGNLMFQGDITNQKWDGKVSSNKEASDGVYFYTYKGTGINGKILEGQGNFQLIK
jgi:gliding motility-associated-like protein